MCATSSIIAHEDCRKAKADGGCRILAADAMGAAWSDEGLLSLAPSSPHAPPALRLAVKG